MRFDRYFEDKDNVYILLDICHNQSLSDLVRRRKRMHCLEARYYIWQLVKGIQYVHSCKFIHRDLKLGNLFLTEKMQLKIGDFGLAAQVYYEGEKKKTICGTPNYLSPEVLESPNGHSYEVDFWAIGVILYTMLCGRPPFESAEVKQTYQKIKVGHFNFPESVEVHPFAKHFIRSCLVLDPAKRMTLEEMLESDYLSYMPVPRQLPVSTLVCPPADSYVLPYRLPDASQLRQNNQMMSPTPKSANKGKSFRNIGSAQKTNMKSPNCLRTDS